MPLVLLTEISTKELILATSVTDTEKINITSNITSRMV